MTTQRRPALLACAALLAFGPIASGEAHSVPTVPARPAPVVAGRAAPAGDAVDARRRHDEADAVAEARLWLLALERARQVPDRASRGGGRPVAARGSAAGLSWPVAGPVVSGFGMRSGHLHEGIDITAAYGTPIHAAKDGTVVFSGTEDGYGNVAIVDHGGGLSTLYAHASRLAAAVGEHVGQGQVIAYVGSTGRSTGAHLHFETHVGGVPQDPRGFLP